MAWWIGAAFYLLTGIILLLLITSGRPELTGPQRVAIVLFWLPLLMRGALFR